MKNQTKKEPLRRNPSSIKIKELVVTSNLKSDDVISGFAETFVQLFGEEIRDKLLKKSVVQEAENISAANSVFISSTFIDLQQHRKLVIQSLSQLECSTTGMEFFGALPESSKEECLRLVRSANIYVGIFGMRYGQIDSISGKSLTQLEYEEAQAMRIPCLIYLIDEEEHPVLPKHVDIGTSARKLAAFKATLRGKHVVNFFSSPKDLATKVKQGVIRFTNLKERNPTAQVLSQIAINKISRHPLTQPRFEYLKKEIAGIFPKNVPDAILRETLELLIGGDNMAAAFLLKNGSNMPLDMAIDSLMQIEKIIVDIVESNNDVDENPKFPTK